MNIKELFDQAEKLRERELLVEAIVGYQQVVDLAKEEKEKWYAAEAMHMIGICFYQLKKNFEAEDYLTKAGYLFLELEDRDAIGAIFRDKAALFVAEDQLDKAEEFLLSSITQLEMGEKKGHLGISKVKLGSLYLKLGRLEEAEKLVLAGIADIKQSDDSFFESSAYFSLAQIEKAQNRILEARILAQKSLHILERISADGHEQRKKEFRQFIDTLI